MKITKLYSYKPEKVKVKFVIEGESIDYAYNIFTQKLTKIIFDDLAPDTIEEYNEYSKLKMFFIKLKLLYKSHF